MSSVEQALATQLRNLQERSGKSLDELYAILRSSGLTRHGELRDLLKASLGMGHGDANTLVHVYLEALPGDSAAGESDPLDAIYAGPKAGLRPIHERFMAGVGRFGPVEVAPKKGYVSLRRKKQFAMLGPATKEQIELGLNAKGLPAAARLKVLPAGGMCQYSVRLSNAGEIDAELMGWVRAAFDAAG